MDFNIQEYCRERQTLSKRRHRAPQRASRARKDLEADQDGPWEGAHVHSGGICRWDEEFWACAFYFPAEWFLAKNQKNIFINLFYFPVERA